MKEQKNENGRRNFLRKVGLGGLSLAGLSMATILACAGFAAVCGSSTATAATMGLVALPEMKRFKYDPALATGCI